MFSVVIPAHDAARTVVEAVQSARGQHRGPREIIVVADRCRDDTAAVAQRAGATVISCDAGSAAAARNLGARRAAGAWIAWLDADDVWLPTWLESASSVVERNPHAAVLHGRAGAWVPGRGVIPAGAQPSGCGDRFERLLFDCFLVTSAAIVRREALLEVGGFDERFAGAGVEDYDLFLRLAARHPMAAVPGEHVRYRRHGGSSIRDPSRLDLRLRETIEVLEEAMSRRPVPPRVRRWALANAYRMSAERRVTAGQQAAARRELLQAMRLRPWDPRHGRLIAAAALPVELVGPALALYRNARHVLARRR